MIRKIVIAGVALGAIVAFAAVSQPVQAGGCVLVSAKARGLGEAAASKRSQAKLMHNINHWANKNKLATVRTGHAPDLLQQGQGWRALRLHLLGEGLPLGRSRPTGDSMIRSKVLIAGVLLSAFARPVTRW